MWGYIHTFSVIIRRNLVLILSLFVSDIFCQTIETAPFVFSGVIPLPEVKGRIDHMAFNKAQNVVYVAALGNNSIEVTDLKSKRDIHSLKGLHEPQGIAFISETNNLVVANGGNGTLSSYDAKTYQLIKSINLGDDTDNVRYDRDAKTLYVGYGSGAIASFNALTLTQNWVIKLPGHPESFQLNKNRLFVNIPTAHLIVVIDLLQKKITRKWEIKEASSNFPMALDDTHNRLFIGCRNPAKLLILDSQTGRLISMLNIDEDTDDLFYDNSSGMIYVSCGKGYLDIIKQSGPDEYQMLTKIETASGTRTSLFIPELAQLIVASPSRKNKEAALLIYRKRESLKQ